MKQQTQTVTGGATMKTAWQLGQEAVAKGFKKWNDDPIMSMWIDEVPDYEASILIDAWKFGRENALSKQVA